MSSYEEQYYILKKRAFRKKILSLRADENTGRRHHTYEKLDYGDGPVFFENGYAGEVPFYLTNVQMDGIYPVVSEDIASMLKKFDIDGFQLFPAIIIDDNRKWHEDFYFFNFYSPLDCVDFEHSEVDEYEADAKCNEVIKYKLKDKILDNIDEENRLIMKLDRVEGGALIFHEKVVTLLSEFEIEAIRFFKLSEYELGMEFR